jgi:periplasmic divalent cation tolerance protein
MCDIATHFMEETLTIKMVYMTAGNLDEASQIAKELVQRRLAACVNIIDGMRSVYEWEGNIQEDQEVVMLAKTHADCLPALEKAVKGMHSYDCPCIVGVDVTGGNNAFLDWVRVQVSTNR